MPGSTHPWPTSDACWSPTRQAIGGLPGRAVASPTTPDESTNRGSRPAGTPSRSSTRPLHSPPSRASKPVTAALVWSVTCSAPPDSDQASQLSTVPKHRSRSRAPVDVVEQPGDLGRRLVRRQASGRARRWAAMHSPTVRRSCHPSAGAIGSAVARSHRIVLARWLVMPTTSTRPADGIRRLGSGVEHDSRSVRRRRTRRDPGTASRAGTDVAPSSRSAVARRRSPPARWSCRCRGRGSPSSSGSPAGRPGCAGAGRGGHRAVRRGGRPSG